MRERKIALCVGSQGSGKTSLAMAFAGRQMAAKQPCIILSPAGVGNVRFPDDPIAYIDELLGRGWRGMLVADDLDRWGNGKLPKGSPLRTIALTGRHVGIDLVATCRRPQELDGVILSGVDDLFVFQLSSADVNGRKRLVDIAPMVEIPTEPHVFAWVQPKTATGNLRRGRTKRSGGFEVMR